MDDTMEKYQIHLEKSNSKENEMIKPRSSGTEEVEAREAICAYFKNMFNIRDEDLILVR